MLRIGSASDLHLGHPRVNAHYLNNSYKALFGDIISKIDLWFLVGDLFDRAINLADASSPYVMEFLYWLLVELDKYNVTARFLQGTFTHDRIQLNHIEALHKSFGLKNDLRIVTRIEIEELPCGLRLVYVPDDLPHKNSDEVVDEIWSLMHKKGWDCVDYALIHGSFDFAGFGGHAPPRICFRNEQFSFVKRKVMVGHIHTPYAKKDVLYHGSPERFARGEEENKGCFYIEDNYPKSIKMTFVENKNSTWFKTFDDSLMDVSSILPIWEERLASCPEGRISYMCMKHPDPGVRAAVSKISRNYPNVVFTSMTSEKDVRDKTVMPDVNIFTMDRVPTAETLPQDILTYLQAENDETTVTLAKIEKYLS